jgi:hypothetical protein
LARVGGLGVGNLEDGRLFVAIGWFHAVDLWIGRDCDPPRGSCRARPGTVAKNAPLIRVNGRPLPAVH